MREVLEVALLSILVADLALVGAVLALTVARMAGAGPEVKAVREEVEAEKLRVSEHARVGRITV